MGRGSGLGVNSYVLAPYDLGASISGKSGLWAAGFATVLASSLLAGGFGAGAGADEETARHWQNWHASGVRCNPVLVRSRATAVLFLGMAIGVKMTMFGGQVEVKVDTASATQNSITHFFPQPRRKRS
jgi:hypothetical protein